MPDADSTFVRALIVSRDPVLRREVLTLVADDDLASPHLVPVLAAVREMSAADDAIDSLLVLDRLVRAGARRPVISALTETVIGDVCPEALRHYAAAGDGTCWVLRRYEGLGWGLAHM